VASEANINDAAGIKASDQNPMVDAHPPTLPHPRMPLAQRAKIFIPFDPLKGYQDALREKEREAEEAHVERASLEEGL
jgi:hypothetical protein